MQKMTMQEPLGIKFRKFMRLSLYLLKNYLGLLWPNRYNPDFFTKLYLQSLGGPWEFDGQRDMYGLLIGDDYGNNPQQKLEQIRQQKAASAKRLIELLKLKGHEEGLEIGSGIGLMSLHMAEQVGHLHLCDISKTFLDQAKKELKNKKNVSFHLLKTHKLPVKDLNLDFIYAHNVFCHLGLYEIYWYLQEVANKLKKGGLFHFDMMELLPTKESQDSFKNMANLYTINKSNHAKLLCYHSRQNILELAQAVGLSVVAILKNDCSAEGSFDLILSKE